MKARRTSDGIVKVVYDHGDVASLHQLQHTVAADVASSTGHQDLLRHGSLGEERPFSAERCVRWARQPGLREGRGRQDLDTVTSALPQALPVLGPASARATSGQERAGRAVAHPANVVHRSWTGRVYLTLVTCQEKTLVLPVKSSQDPGVTHIAQRKALGLIHP